MNKMLLPVLLLLICCSSAFAQFSQKKRDSINRLNAADHQLMMNKFGIESLRPGPSGNPADPNAANSDESKASNYEKLPDPLILNDGRRVSTKDQWQERRKEIIEDFDREVYGRLPENVPGVNWKTVSEKDTMIGEYPAKVEELLGVVDNSSYPQMEVNIKMTLTTPLNTENEVPVILKFDWNWPAGFAPENKDPNPWQEQILKKNWGYASLIPTSYQADNGAGLREGIIGLVNKGEPRNPDDWGTLRAWAWGASRALDYFEEDDDVDASRVAIEGLSRYGKAAVVAMAYDERFAVGFIGSAGAGGTKILRRNFGEQVENLASSAEYHWFAPNFLKYAGPLTVEDLPVDAHHLIALAAPRPLFISTGNPEVEGNWVDARGMFLGAVHASPVYELLEEQGLETFDYPKVGDFLSEGKIGFRIHEGGHTVEPNWPYFIRFAERFF